MTLGLIDTHAHLADDQFQKDLVAVIDRALQTGIRRVVAVATTLASTHHCLELAAQYPAIAPTAGIHPNNAVEALTGDWDKIVLTSTKEQVCAIGETGLDRHWHDTPFPLQEDYYSRHLGLARERDLPVIIHTREADEDMLRMLREEFDRHGPIKGVMHSFTGNVAMAQACLAMGLYISFAGMVTYKNNPDLREVAKTIPLDRLLVETDSPYLAPIPMRGQRNEPANVRYTVECLAHACAIEIEELASHLTRNSEVLFGLR